MASSFVAIVAAVISGMSFWSSRRSAHLAERAVDAQTRPLLTDVAHGTPLAQPQPIVLPNGREHLGRRSGEVLVNAHEGWISVPLRNVGNGVAHIDTVVLLGGGSLLKIASEQFAARPYNVPPGEETRINIQADNEEGRAHIHGAARSKGGLGLKVGYTDLSGEIEQTVSAALVGAADSTDWVLTSVVQESGFTFASRRA